MRKFFSVILTIVLCMGASLQAEGQEDTPPQLQQLYAHAAILMDADTGRVLFEKNGYEQKPMASTTKIMTLIVALENANWDEVVTVSEYAAGMPDVQLHVRKGEQYRLKDLLYSMMLESHNDSAVAIAEHVGGSVKAFARMMNDKARDIGCYDTYFITPNGLDAADETGQHSTTAVDLARIMRYCISLSPKKEEFLEVTRTASYSFGDLEGLRSFTVNNKNAFLGMMEGALSGKTGFTNQAGYCYTGALKQGERTFVVSLLACGWPNHRTYKWSDTRKLMNYGLENYEYRDVWEPVLFEAIPTENGIPESGDLQKVARVMPGFTENADERRLELLLSEQDRVEVRLDLPRILEAPVEAGSVIGYVGYYLNGEMVEAYPVAARNRVERISLSWCWRKVANKYLKIL